MTTLDFKVWGKFSPEAGQRVDLVRVGNHQRFWVGEYNAGIETPIAGSRPIGKTREFQGPQPEMGDQLVKKDMAALFTPISGGEKVLPAHGSMMQV